MRLKFNMKRKLNRKIQMKQIFILKTKFHFLRLEMSSKSSCGYYNLPTKISIFISQVFFAPETKRKSINKVFASTKIDETHCQSA